MLRLTCFSLVLVLSFGCGDDDGSSRDTGAVGDVGSSGETFMVDFVTTAGDFTVEVHPDWAPRGAARFRELVEAEYFDDCRFFRVLPGFVAQFGMHGDPAVNSEWTSRPINADPVIGSNTRGTLTYAMTSDPNSRTTQLFINYADNTSLNGSGFAPFGEIVGDGMDAVDAINSEYGETPSQGRIASEGNAYLGASFPNLDYIMTARIR